MAILIYIPFKSNIGYAIRSLESTFFNVAMKVYKDQSKIFFCYQDLSGGKPDSLPRSFENYFSIENEFSKKEHKKVCQLISKHNIHTFFGLDIPVNHPAYKFYRSSGIKQIFAYWGAPMSSLNPPLKLLVKKLEVFLNRSQPDHYIFESKAMAKSATMGRGVSSKRISVVNLGVDTNKYTPLTDNSPYVSNLFLIPPNRRIVTYSGHMEKRKGVDIIVKAAAHIVNSLNRDDIHFLLLGNKDGEEQQYSSLYKNTKAENFITFGGYRDDLHLIFPCCHIGVIASTGWDSFTKSSLEMASCGLPRIVSDLQGLPETIIEGKSGVSFTPGDYIALSDKILSIIDTPEQLKKMSLAARNQASETFSIDHQESELTRILQTYSKEL